MAGDTFNTDAIDHVLAETPPKPIDEVRVRADELVELRRKAALADTLQRDAASTLTAAAVTEASASARFANDVAATHARTLLRERVIVRPDEHGRLAAFDRVSGRPAAAALREALDGDDFKMFISASHQGGGGGGNTPPDRPKDETHARRMAMASGMLGGKLGPGGTIGTFGGFRQ